MVLILAGSALLLYPTIGDYGARKTMSAAGKFSNSFYEFAANLILETDRAIKTSLDDGNRLLESLVMQLAQEARS